MDWDGVCWGDPADTLEIVVGRKQVVMKLGQAGGQIKLFSGDVLGVYEDRSSTEPEKATDYRRMLMFRSNTRAMPCP